MVEKETDIELISTLKSFIRALCCMGNKFIIYKFNFRIKFKFGIYEAQCVRSIRLDLEYLFWLLYLIFNFGHFFFLISNFVLYHSKILSFLKYHSIFLVHFNTNFPMFLCAFHRGTIGEDPTALY